jgi:hypothetical protein
MVKLHVTLPGFAPDFLQEGVFLVSADWRAAAQLSETKVIYLPVDASTSLPEVQAKDDKVLWPVAVRDWIDLERSPASRSSASTSTRSSTGRAPQARPATSPSSRS